MPLRERSQTLQSCDSSMLLVQLHDSAEPCSKNAQTAPPAEHDSSCPQPEYIAVKSRLLVLMELRKEE